MTVNGRANRLCPDRWFGVAVLPSCGLRSGVCAMLATSVGVPRKLFQPAAMSIGVRGSLERGRDRVERIDQSAYASVLRDHSRLTRGIAREVQWITDAREHLRAHHGRRCQLTTRILEDDQMSGEVPAVDRRDVLRVQRTKIESCRTSCRSVRGSARAYSSFRGLPPAAPRSRVIPSQPKSWAAVTERRYRPRLVGDVRCATTGVGSS